MKIFFFGLELDIPAGSKVPFEVRGVTYAELSNTNDNLISVSFSKQFVFSPDGVYKVEIALGSAFKIDLTDQNKNSLTGTCTLSIWSFTVQAEKPHLDRSFFYFKASSANLSLDISKKFLSNIFPGILDNANFQTFLRDRVLTGFSPDCKGDCLELRMNNVPLMIQDAVNDVSGEQVEHQQMLVVNKLIIASNKHTLIIHPLNGVVYIAPDVFTLFEQPGIEEKVFIQYQFALVNGELSFEFSPLFKPQSIFWKKANDIPVNAGVALLKYSDENGLPLVLNFGEPETRTQLVYRHGLTNLLNEESTSFPDKEYEMTIRGISIEAVKGRLHPISFGSIDWNKREKQLFGLGWKEGDHTQLLAQPFWLKNEEGRFTVKLEQIAPAAIYGVGKGSWLSKTKTDAEASIHLEMEPVKLDGKAIYHLHNLKLEKTQWDLHSLYEEKESHSLTDNAAISLITSRRFDSTATGKLELPATDYLFGATNIYHPPMMRGEPGGLTTEIPKAVSLKLESINKAFKEYSFKTSPQEHISKFQRIYKIDEEKPAGLLQTLPLKTKELVHLERLPLQLETPAVPAAEKTGEKTFPLTFKHGRKTPALPVPAPVPGDLEASIIDTKDAFGKEEINNKIRQLQRLWNEGLYLIQADTLKPSANDTASQKLAKALRRIRHYLDGDSQPELRVKFLDTVHRLQLKALAPVVEQKKLLFDRIANFLEGNLNAVTGLGNRLRVLRPWLEKMKAKVNTGVFTELEVAWDKGVEKFRTDEDALLNAIFDFVYKQPDRELISNLLVLVKKAEDLPGDLKDAVKILKDEFKDLFNPGAITQEAIDSVLTQVLQGTDPYVVKMKDLWNENVSGCTDITAEQLKGRYGSFFDMQTYKKIIQDNDEKVIKCLEKRLREKLKSDFSGLLDKIIAEILKNIDENADKLLLPYEEDIVALFLMAEQADQFLRENKPIFDALKTVNSPDKLKAALKTLGLDLRKTAYNYFRNYLLEQFAHAVKELETVTDAEIDKLINQYSDEIMIVIGFIEQYQTWKNEIIPQYKKLFDRTKASIKDLLKTLTNRDVLLGLLKKYLKEKHGFNISFADLRVDPPQYIVYSKHISFNIDPAFVDQFNSILAGLHLDKYQLCKLGDGKGWDFLMNDSSVYILKLGNDMTAGEILADINERNKKSGAKKGPLGDAKEVEAIGKDFHRDISEKKWRGLIILNPVADIGNDELLRDLAGKSQVKMKYAAIGGGENLLGGGLDVYARVFEENTPPPTSDKENDAKLTLVKFDASIKNTELESGDIVFYLNFKNIFGKIKDFDQIIIKGTLPPPDKNSPGPRSFEFSAQLSKPIRFDLDIAFLKSVEIKGITASRKNKKSTLDIDGSMTFAGGENGAKGISVYDGQNQVVLKNFRLTIPEPRAGTSTRIGLPRGIDIDISGIEFVFNKPRPINFGFMELLPKGISYFKRMEDPDYSSFIGSKIWITRPPDKGHPFTCLNLKLQFGKLPAMGGAGISNLELSGLLGFSIDNPAKGPYFAIDSAGGKDVSIDLFRFITLYIKELFIGQGKLINKKGTADITLIKAMDAQLKILGWSPLGKDGQLSLVFLQEKPVGSQISTAPTTGFVALANKKPGQGGNEQGWNIGPLKIYWILVAHNLVFDGGNLFKLLVEPTSEDSGAFEKLDIFGGDNIIKNLSFSEEESWLFGASFSIAEILERCSFILHDQHFYGIMLASKQPWFEKLFGTKKLALAYMPGPTKEQDRFRIEFGIPLLDLLGKLQSGLVAIEYAMNRDFLVDFGFPWRTGKTYMWSRTFAVRGGIYETRFGFYFEKKTEPLLGVDGDGQQLITIGAGIGLYYGYYIGSRNFYAYAEAGIGITVILTGSVTFKTPKGGGLSVLKGTLVKVEVTGVIGIYGYARGCVDYWIFSASIRAEMVAALSGTLVYMPKGNSSLTYSSTISARYHASATIKIGFARKSFSISGSLSYGISGRIALN